MDIQTRKLNLIALLTQLKDEKLIQKIELFVLNQQRQQSTKIKPFTVEQLIERIEISEIDYKLGKFKSQKEVEKNSENWK